MFWSIFGVLIAIFGVPDASEVPVTWYTSLKVEVIFLHFFKTGVLGYSWVLIPIFGVPDAYEVPVAWYNGIKAINLKQSLLSFYWRVPSQVYFVWHRGLKNWNQHSKKPTKHQFWEKLSKNHISSFNDVYLVIRTSDASGTPVIGISIQKYPKTQILKKIKAITFSL